MQHFVADYNCSIVKHFNIKAPDYTNPVIVKVMGVSGDKSDGEQHILPVLSNRQLVTESMTLPVRGNETKEFEFAEWKDNKSKTAVNHSLTLEYAGNPAWYAVNSLYWLSQNPYDCMEQTFSKIFANSVPGLILDKNPQIDSILHIWKESGAEASVSPLMKNQDLKSALIEETPWAIDGKSQTDRMKVLKDLLKKERINAENESRPNVGLFLCSKTNKKKNTDRFNQSNLCSSIIIVQ